VQQVSFKAKSGKASSIPWFQAGLFAQFVGSYPINGSVSFDGYYLLPICIDRVFFAFPQKIKFVSLKILY
jgi:hypothetical protein